jgi:probable phosphoglycerate mutase
VAESPGAVPGTDEARTRLVVVRHGETEWSRVGRHTGRSDLPLTADGEASARALAPALAGWSFACVLTSPLQRARRTAELLGHPDATADADLLEWDYGDYEGMTRAEIVAARGAPWDPFRDGFPGGEPLADVAARLDRVVARVRAVGGDVLAVAHGHSLKVLAARWLGLPPQDGRILALDTATLSILGWYHAEPAVELWNAPAGLAVTARTSAR